MHLLLSNLLLLQQQGAVPVNLDPINPAQELWFAEMVALAYQTALVLHQMFQDGFLPICGGHAVARSEGK